MTQKVKAALKTLKDAGYRVKLQKGSIKTRIKNQFVRLSKAFRRKGHVVREHTQKTSKALRIHGYWRKHP